MSALKNLHIFLKVVSVEKRSQFIKYIVQTFDDSIKSEWRLKQVLASNLGNYCELFEKDMVYTEFLPMFFKFCSDNVMRVSQSTVTALCPILMKFNDDEQKQASIARIIKSRYCKARTFKKRQLFVMMMNGPMMQQKEVFEKYFKIEFLTMVNDRVSNVRIQVAKVLKHHFLKEISGAFVYDSDMNDAVKLLKQDPNVDVQYIVSEIEPTVKDDNKNLTMDSFLKSLDD